MTAGTITCKNCSNQFQGNYCNRCGEKVYDEHHKSLAHIFEEGFHFLTHFDGTFFKTLKAIFTRPGQLSYDYCDGIRKSYFKPLSFFLLLVVVYLLFPAFEGLNMRLFYHTTSSVYKGFAAEKISELMSARGLSFEQVSEQFHLKSAKVSKFLLLLLIPLTALVLWAMSFRRRRYFYDQVVLSSELNAFYLLAIFLIFPLILTLILLVLKLFGIQMMVTDNVIGIVGSTVLFIFARAAFRRFYGVTQAQSVLMSLGYLVGHYIMVQWVYKFILFCLVYWMLKM